MARLINITVDASAPDYVKRMANDIESELERIFAGPLVPPIKSSSALPKANVPGIIYISETDRMAYADLTTNIWKYINDGLAV